MSVEEARATIHKYCDLVFWAYADPGLDTSITRRDEAIDRLILEVQAEMPCYMNRNRSGLWDCISWNEYDHAERVPEQYQAVEVCPSCTARMKLKETADAR